jgi:hypothetical protein
VRASCLWLLVAVACGRTATPADEPPELEPLFVSGERLRARVADAGAGARRLLDWYDTVLETTCTFRLMEDGVYRCVHRVTRPIAIDVSSATSACAVLVDRRRRA